MKKIVYNLLSALLLVLFFLSSNIFINTAPFSSKEAMKNIKYLSSEHFKGRLAGTFENEEAEFYIRGQFIKNGIQPLGKSYFEEFTAACPSRINGMPFLKVVTANGDVVHEYKYGTDYKEDMLCFRSNSFTFSKALKPYMSNNSIAITNGKNKYIFYVPQNDNLDFRSSFINDAPFDMYIMITSSTLKDIKGYVDKGYSISCFIPFTPKEDKLNNITAEIKGKQPFAPPVVLTAHFDHVGTDLDGKVYCGALDNASGISFLLELSRYINSLGIPDRNILFIGFNAEEFGCKGSEEFVKINKDLLKDASVYNFDMIGGGDSIPFTIMAGKKDSPFLPLIDSLKSECTKDKIPFNYIFEDSSDHESFRKENISAVTLTDHDTSRIHTSKDTADSIKLKNIDRCFKVVSDEVIKRAYYKNPIVLFNSEIMILSSLGVVLIILFSILKEE